MAWQKVTIPIPKGFDPSERKAIGEAMLDMIRDRSAQGVGVKKSGNSFKTYDFPEYTEAYKKKKGSSKVDLTLTGNMLHTLVGMGVISTKPDSILIGFENGSKENGKAEGNQIGSYGRSPDPKKARRFLGITKDELEAILAGFE